MKRNPNPNSVVFLSFKNPALMYVIFSFPFTIFLDPPINKSSLRFFSTFKNGTAKITVPIILKIKLINDKFFSIFNNNIPLRAFQKEN